MKPALIVLDPGLFATLQDLGRQGYQCYGVSGSGAMDEVSLRIANVLVGNSVGEAAVEFTFSGGVWEADCASCRVAVAGDFPVRIDDVPAPAFTSHTLRRGSRLAIGRAASGLRGYLAVAGGFDIAPALGSLSTHTRAGFGGFEGAALKPGARLPLRQDTAEGPDLALGAADWPSWGECVRVVLGPQDDHFTPDGLRTFLESPYTITAQSDRMGYRLEGAPIEHSGDFNIISDGIVAGSIQVPGSRQPIILLADRQPTGGYPKIATAISADLPALAQKRPGEVIRFAPVSQDEAEELRMRMLERLDLIRERLRPAPGHRTILTSERLLATNLISGVIADLPLDETR
ncbi:MAG: biotin-dependent carboxyltransferase family protein [Rhodospirillales bacterium]|nr:biotin-dependent carboxyltransferase family protein [Rhodospirillales bacterium]